MDKVYGYQTLIGTNTIEHYTETVLVNPKKYIAGTLIGGKARLGMTVAELERRLKNQDFKYTTTYCQYVSQTRTLGNYRIDGLLRMLDALELEIIIQPKTR